MANPEHLAILEKGGEVWNEWIADANRGVPRHNVDLTGAALAEAELAGRDLRGCDLRGADLRLTHLLHADLSGARLQRADLQHADLTRAVLEGTKLLNADLRAASLSGARVIGADLRGADLRDTNLSDTIFVGVRLNDANLRGAVFGGSVLGACDLTRTDLRHVEFHWPCVLDPATVASSPGLPDSFLQGCGWPERLIEYWPSIVGHGIELYSGFISYSHAEPDRYFARRLHDQLQGRGIRVWRDEHELNPGDPIMAEIDRAVRLWDKTLLCCSKASLTSWWVDREIEKAIKKEEEIYRERGERVIALIPLNLDGFLFSGWEHPYKSYLTQRLAADFTGWESDNTKFEAQLERVVRTMTVGGGKPPPPESKL